MDIIDRLKNICIAAWEKVVDYYSFVPFSHIIIFNLTVPPAAFIMIDINIKDIFVYIAANVLFFLYRMKNADVTGMRISGRETVKKLALTIVISAVEYTVIELIGLIYFIYHLPDMF